MTKDVAPKVIDISPVSAATEYATRIRSRLADSVENFIDVGRILAEAKRKLSHGEFTHMVEADLPFGARTAQRFMAIAGHPQLSKATDPSCLPPACDTLYELSRLSTSQWKRAEAAGLIRPDVERREVTAFFRRKRERARRVGDYEDLLGWFARLAGELEEAAAHLRKFTDPDQDTMREAARLGLEDFVRDQLPNLVRDNPAVVGRFAEAAAEVASLSKGWGDCTGNTCSMNNRRPA